MSVTSIRIKKLAIRLVDWLLLIGIAAWAINAIIKAAAEERPLIGIAALVGMAAVNFIGRWTVTKIAVLNHEESTTIREQNRKEQFEKDHGSIRKH